MSLQVKSREEGDISILELSGLLTMGPATQRLKSALSELFDNDRNRIVLNVAAVSLLDSSGVGEVVGGFTDAKNSGGALKVACLSDRVREVFQVTGLLSVLDIHDTEQDAIASFG